jgi:hypothetical protein
MIVGSDYGTKPEKQGTPNNLLHVRNISDWENVNENSWPIIVYSPLRKTNQEKHNQTQGETHI